jgi:uncharacterized YigZ family protein
MLNDTYKTILQEVIGEYKDRGSKFIAYAAPVFNKEDWQLYLEKIKKEHPKAQHHCFAFRVGVRGEIYRANDDGEPSGTAGRPILGQIDVLGLTNIFVVVVRYFGGTLLGVSGLIQAYREATADALRQAVVTERVVEDLITLTFEYAKMSDVMNALKILQIPILQQDFLENATLIIAIRQSETDDKLLRLRAAVGKLHLEEAQLVKKIDGFSVVIRGVR